MSNSDISATPTAHTELTSEVALRSLLPLLEKVRMRGVPVRPQRTIHTGVTFDAALLRLLPLREKVEMKGNPLADLAGSPSNYLKALTHSHPWRTGRI